MHNSHPTSPAASREAVCAGAHATGRRMWPAAAEGQGRLGAEGGGEAESGAGGGVEAGMGRREASAHVTRSARHYQIALMLGLLVAMLHSATGAGEYSFIRRWMHSAEVASSGQKMSFSATRGRRLTPKHMPSLMLTHPFPMHASQELPRCLQPSGVWITCASAASTAESFHRSTVA